MCPEPVQRAESLLRELAPGGILTILVTDPAAEIDLEAWCRQTGNTYVDCRQPDHWQEICIRKRSA